MLTRPVAIAKVKSNARYITVGSESTPTAGDLEDIALKYPAECVLDESRIQLVVTTCESLDATRGNAPIRSGDHELNTEGDRHE
jgi:hypothetical protein